MAITLLLDTNTYADLTEREPGVCETVRRAGRILISPVVIGELLGGFRYGTRFEKNLSILRAFLEAPHVTLPPMTYETADRYGRIVTDLRRKGTPIPTNDVWIAAQTMETGARLLSRDAHFRHVDGLAWEIPS